MLTVLELVGGNSDGGGHLSVICARLAVDGERLKGLVLIADGNPDTSASAASRCVDGVVPAVRVACGVGRGRGERDTVYWVSPSEVGRGVTLGRGRSQLCIEFARCVADGNL